MTVPVLVAVIFVVVVVVIFFSGLLSVFAVVVEVVTVEMEGASFFIKGTSFIEV